MRTLVLAIVALIALPLAAAISGTETAWVDGVVVDYDGTPVRGARVTLVDESTLRALTPSAVTDAAGRFRLQSRPDARGRLIARKPALPATSLLLPELEKARHGITLKFPQGVEVKGAVTSDDGRPVGGVSINQDMAARLFSYSSTDPVEDWARTADDGTFSVRIEELPADLHFAKDRYVPMTVPVEATQSIRPLAVRLKQLQFVRGKLVRKDGTAVGGEIISSSDLPGNPTTSAEDGSFELGFPTAGEHVVEAGLVNMSQSVRAPCDGVRLIYDEGLTISGRVIDEATGEPVEGRIELTSEASGLSIITSSPVAGPFTFKGFEPETVIITVSANGYSPAKVKVEAEQAQPVVIALQQAVTLRGRVNDADGKPVDYADIRGEEGQVGQSDGDGRFEVQGFATDRPATLTIMKPGYLNQSITIPPEGLRKVADILLPAGFTVRGRVLAPDGKPASVRVVASSTAHGASSGRGACDENGQFEITALAPARYDFVVDQESDLSGALRDVDVEQVHEITIQLHRSPLGVVTGRVVGIPAAFTQRTIAVEGVETGKPMSPDGTFRIDDRQSLGSDAQGEQNDRGSGGRGSERRARVRDATRPDRPGDAWRTADERRACHLRGKLVSVGNHRLRWTLRSAPRAGPLFDRGVG
jgi:protocatechuate 3,4-dioxygenase beta subunit